MNQVREARRKIWIRVPKLQIAKLANRVPKFRSTENTQRFLSLKIGKSMNKISYNYSRWGPKFARVPTPADYAGYSQLEEWPTEANY